MDMTAVVRGAEPLEIACADGVRLGATFWPTARPRPLGAVIVSPATGVAARYYHRYAAFLAARGFDALTYDYRGVGRSRPARLRGLDWRWRDWGERDFPAALAALRRASPEAPPMAVGHSIGGILPGMAPGAEALRRMLTVGAQIGWRGDYAPAARRGMTLKWHVAMPALTALCGWFPGRRLGWLEDLPAGVAREWAFRRARLEASWPAAERPALLARFAALRASILAVAVTDDPFAPPAAVRRGLGYFRGAPARLAILAPAALGHDAIGHFGLFHERHREDFWRDSLRWLARGENPWPAASGPRPVS